MIVDGEERPQVPPHRRQPGPSATVRHTGGSGHSEVEASPDQPGDASPDHRHWFEPLADHMGAAYLRYSFTKGTTQEVEYLVDRLGLRQGSRVLDVGCGPGRHAHELARRGVEVHGIDISETFVRLARHSAPHGATFEVLDARALPYDGEVDAVISLCQGGFGLMTAAGEDELVIAGIARALKPGGIAAMSAFSAYFVMRYQTDADFDADLGVNHERTEVKNQAGDAKAVDLWTGCYTPRELRLLMEKHGLEVEQVSSVRPGEYGDAPPTVESEEFLVIARKP